MSENIEVALTTINGEIRKVLGDTAQSPRALRELRAIEAQLLQAQQLERIADALEPINVSIRNVDVAIQNLQRMRGRVN